MVDPADVAKSQTHLSSSQQEDYKKLLSKDDTLFDGTLGQYPHKKLHLQLKEGAVSVHHKASPIAHAHTEVFKKRTSTLGTYWHTRMHWSYQMGYPNIYHPEKRLSSLRGIQQLPNA
jgi:hypothetical protein